MTFGLAIFAVGPEDMTPNANTIHHNAWQAMARGSCNMVWPVVITRFFQPNKVSDFGLAKLRPKPRKMQEMSPSSVQVVNSPDGAQAVDVADGEKVGEAKCETPL